MKNPETEKTFGILSLVNGIIGFFAFGIILGITSIILGALSWDSKLGKIGFIIGLVDVIGVLYLLS